MELYILTHHPKKVRDVATTYQFAFAVGIKEGERWKYFAVNPKLCDRTSTGFGFVNPIQIKLKNATIDDMMHLYHELIEKYGFLEMDYGSVTVTKTA